MLAHNSINKYRLNGSCYYRTSFTLPAASLASASEVSTPLQGLCSPLVLLSVRRGGARAVSAATICQSLSPLLLDNVQHLQAFPSRGAKLLVLISLSLTTIFAARVPSILRRLIWVHSAPQCSTNPGTIRVCRAYLS